MSNLYLSLLGLASRRSSAMIADENLHLHYCSLIRKTLQQCGVKSETLQIDLRCVDKASDGKPVYAAMIYIAQWERVSTLRLLIGLPLIESRLRDAARSSWMASQSHFVGIWLHASSRLEAPDELRSIIVQLTADDLGGSQEARDSLPRAPDDSSRPADEGHAPRSYPLTW